jgi:acetate kinase
LGISGVSNDMRTLTEKAEEEDERARLAIDVFCYRVKKYLGAYAAVLGTLDAVVFTGGIGENAPAIRAQCCDQLAQLGIVLDRRRNAAVIRREGEIQSKQSRVKVLVIPTDEEAVIARDTYELTQEMAGEAG